MKLDPETSRWIEVALEHIKYGEIVITVHDHKVVGVDTKKRERVTQPHQMRYSEVSGISPRKKQEGT